MARKPVPVSVEGVEFTTKTVSTAELVLDPDNPRLPAADQGASQPRLREILIERFKVTELAESIVTAGYNAFDPILGYQPKQDGKITVLEGNRRVATIQLLLDPELAPKAHRDRWLELSAQLPHPTRNAIQTLSVRVYKKRDAVDVLSYIGFRHVTGVLTWAPLEKAQYIARLIDDFSWTYKQIAQRLGSYPKIVERHYVAYRLVRQAQDEEHPGSELLETSFGVLIRGLQASGVAEFLGVEYPGDPKKSQSPVSKAKLPQLADFVRWTFGTGKTPPVVKDSRQLTQWGKILQSPSAVAYLRRTPSPEFERAWIKSGGQAESVAESLYKAADRLEESAPLVSEYVDNEEVTSAVQQCARFFVQVIEHFPAIAKEYGLKLQNA
jgi:hypothetical protein